jgi:uncharacterized membrane protein
MMSAGTIRGGLLAVLLACGAAGGARAEQPIAASPWSLAFYKMATYEIAANAYDLVLYRALAGAAAAPAFTFLAANTVADGAAYYIHELAWDRLAPMPGDAAGASRIELAKTLTFRVVSTVTHGVAFYALAGDPVTAVGFGVAANLGEAAIYLANEWAWRPAVQALSHPSAAP